QLALAAAETKRISVGTSIALAFTRSPTTLAYAAWDLQSLSNGRLILGLGSQVKGHIERRFGMRWESPAPKMKDYVAALRAVWECWQQGKELRFNGRFYKLSLMTPFFNPGPIEHPNIPVYLAGVNEVMCKVAGTVADGLHVHPLHTPRYLREVITPSLTRGLEQSGRKREELSVSVSVFAAAGETAKEIAAVKEFYRQQVSFYASTRTYRKLMELHGWGGVAERLHQYSVNGQWDRMAGEVGDEILREFVVEGTWGEMGAILARRYRGLADRIKLYLPFDGTEEWKGLVSGFRV
ncbi:MAG TPA: TIGR03617 family F420-dependent LLM class oxidoreductase, partial [Nitrososphaerales archaeon]|nr:TIGR03617 family F420-dependent LLM class oxidoreductase [Nitrososphaerales archaeon]